MVIDENPRTCVVLHGRGFVGRSLVLRLLKLGNWIVRIADSDQSLHLDPTEQNSVLSEAIATGRASYYHVDVRDKSQVSSAIEGSSVVFHMDAAHLYTHDIYFCYMIIVQGTKNVINACRKCNVKRLIYNSSADIVFDGSCDIRNGDESLPNPSKFEDTLSDLKAQAEALVQCANDYDGLLTCSLRPSNVFGPGDTQLVPFLVNQARSGWAKFIIGSGENISDFTFVENVSHAHICAEEALRSRMVSVSGKAFFITNLEPVKFWEFVSLILEGLGYQRPTIKLPAGMVRHIIFLVKWMHERLGSRKHSSLSAHYFVQLASCTRTFDCTAAEKHIGYSPIVPQEKGVELTIQSFSHLAKDAYFIRDEHSRSDKLLGSGKVADILLWRDEKKTFMYFITVVLLFQWFFLCERTFISSAAKFLLLVTVILFLHGFLPAKMFGFSIQKIPLSCFKVHDTSTKYIVAGTVSLWNRGVGVIKSLAQGEDWSLFFKVAVFLYFLRMIMSHSLTGVIGFGLVLSFTSFFIYEQYEAEIDGLASIVFDATMKLMELLMENLPASVSSFLHKNESLN